MGTGPVRAQRGEVVAVSAAGEPPASPPPRTEDEARARLRDALAGVDAVVRQATEGAARWTPWKPGDPCPHCGTRGGIKNPKSMPYCLACETYVDA